MAMAGVMGSTAPSSSPSSSHSPPSFAFCLYPPPPPLYKHLDAVTGSVKEAQHQELLCSHFGFMC